MRFHKEFSFKILTGAVLLTMILSIIAPILLYPKKAEAQWVTTDIVAQIQRLWRNIKDELNRVWDTVKRQWAAVAYKNALRVLVGELARNTAEWIASGGKEQKPLFVTTKDFFLKAGDQALGAFIEEMTEGTALENLGCEMLPEAKFNLIKGVASFRRIYKRGPFPKARCPVSMRWRNLKASVENNVFRLIDLLRGLSQDYRKQKTIIENDGGIGGNAKLDLLKIIDRLQKAQDKVDNIIVSLYASWTTEMVGAETLDQGINRVNDLIREFDSIERDLEPQFNLTKECAVIERDKFCENVGCRNYLCLESVNEETCKNQVFLFKTKCADPANKTRIYFGSLVERKAQTVSLLTELKKALEKTVLPPEEMARIDTPEDLILMFTMEGNPIATTLKGLSESIEREAEAEQKEIIALQANSMKPIETKISEEVIVPSVAVDEQVKQPIQKSTKVEEIYTGELAADFISIFTSTLAGKLFEKWFLKEGLNPGASPASQKDVGGGTWRGGGREAAKTVYADLATVSFLRGSETYNVVDEFAACPTETKFAGINNCVIDTPFAQAIRQNLTIREAIEKDYLHGNWYVGGYGLTDSAKDFASRYSLTNIKKLRKARVVPLGLEIAATKISQGEFGDQLFTLSEIVGGFDDVDSGFYHLVDPNWVLKAPAMRCNLMTYSAVPLPNSAERQTVCLDVQDCIGENPDDSCHTYGYCTREKNIWRMTGTECPAHYNTCQVYTRTRDNQQFSWLKNTLDFAGCDQNSVGCKWYCQNWDRENKTWACSNGLKFENGKPNAIFFNRQVEKCQPIAEGCNEFIQTKEGLGSNLLPNSSFEDGEKCDLAEICQANQCDCLINGQFKCKVLRNESDCPINVTGWSVTGGDFVIDRANTESGRVVARINQAWGGPEFGNEIKNKINSWFIPGYSYTISVWIKNNNNESQNIYLFAKEDNGTAHELFKQQLPANSDWRRLSYSFKYPLEKNNTSLDVKTLRWEIGQNTAPNLFVYFDGMQLETGASASLFYTDYRSANLTYLKKAPDWMNCYDNRPDNDDPQCFDFIKSCRQDEVGCELYTPTTGRFAVSAIVTSDNRCPAECVNYETFKEMSTNFSPDRNIVNFIPKTGRFCSADQVGCEEFTNLDVVAKGGEGKEYYSYLRECLKLPEAASQCSYYYTWVGSDTSGYQLRRYYLKKANRQYPGDPNANGPDVVPNPRVNLGECNSPNDILTNPHCKQFYDATGNIYYRIYENTISCSEDCHPYRKTIPAVYNYQDYNGDEGVDDSDCRFINAEPTTELKCRQILNSLIWSGKCCTKTNFMAIPSEGISCSSVNAGCREYKGNAAYNIRQVFLDVFETGTVDPWETESSLATLIPSTESIYFGGRSMKAKIKSQVPAEIILLRDISGQVSQGKSYLLSFLIKGVGAGEIEYAITGSPVQKIATNEIADWRLITLGPLYLANLPAGKVRLTITAKANIYEPPPEPNGGYYTFFIDNILLKEVRESIYLIKDSWQTPTSCDSPTPGAMLYCEEYRDRFGKTHYLKSFTRLCKEEVVGCEALIETKNSANPFEEKFNITGSVNPVDYLIIPQDEMKYFVNDLRKSCHVSDLGCQKFGLPTLDANGAVVNWLDQFLRNNPNQYLRKPILCSASSLNCEEFMPANKTTPVYFKDPGEKICQWREKVPIGAEYKSGWFKRGTNQPCYYDERGNPYMPDGLTYGIKKANERGYFGWAGECEEKHAGCNEYFDPNSKTSYYYLDNDRLDKSSCRGQVSLKEGCVLFEDRSNPEAIYNSIATYAKSDANQSRLVSPIDCTKKPWLDSEGNCNSGGEYSNTDYCKYCATKEQTTNDTNLILKVRRDRVCGEWLHCSGSRTVWDKSLGENREVCDSLLRCDKMIGQGSKAECISFPNVSGVLTEDVYKRRDTSWAGMDYSGYSLFNLYPVEKLQPRNYGTNIDPNYQLTYFDSQGDHGPGGKRCSTDKDCPNNGKCVGIAPNKYCTIPKTCQAYPENDSPFVSESKIKQYYSNVNFCNDEKGEECQCFYKKAEYGVGGAVKKYFNTTTALPAGFCVIAKGDKKVGNTCDPNKVGSNPGECGFDDRSVQQAQGCEGLTKETIYYGQRNFCLELDPTKPAQINACLTWWPAGAGAGDPDIYNQFKEAGYFALDGRRWYCVEQGGEFSKGLKKEGTGPEEINWSFEFVEKQFDPRNGGPSSNGECKIFQWKLKENECNGENQICYVGDQDDDTLVDITQLWEYDDESSNYGCFVTGGGNCEGALISKYKLKDSVPDPVPGPMPKIPLAAIDRISIKTQSNDNTAKRCLFSGDSDWQWGSGDVSICSANDWGNNRDEECNDGNGSSRKNGDDYAWFYLKSIGDQSKWLNGYYFVIEFDDGSPNDGGFEIIAPIKIHFKKSYCKQLYKIADDSGLTTAWTNRMKLKDPDTKTPYEDPPNNEEPYKAVCEPRGASNTNQPRIGSAGYENSIIVDVDNNEECDHYTAQIYGNTPELNQLFARGYSFTSNENTCAYSEFSSPKYMWECISGSPNDVRSTIRDNAANFAPKVSPVCFNQTGTPIVCRDPNNNPISGLTIGNNNSGNITRTRAYTAVLKFYGWADRNQMPIRELVIDWDDGIKTNENVSMLAKNHKEKCTNKCYNQEGLTNEQSCSKSEDCNSAYPECIAAFGDSSDACVEQYWQFTHTYICKGEESPGWKKHNCTNACCFKPKVYLKDNWGWCAGATPKNNGYAGDNFCSSLTSPKTNVPYSDLIIVKPLSGGLVGSPE